MQGKEVFLEKNKNVFLFILFLFLFLFNNQAKSNQNEDLIKNKLIEYLLNTKEISSGFIQINNDFMQEGTFHLKKDLPKNYGCNGWLRGG